MFLTLIKGPGFYPDDPAFLCKQKHLFLNVCERPMRFAFVFPQREERSTSVHHKSCLQFTMISHHIADRSHISFSSLVFNL